MTHNDIEIKPIESAMPRDVADIFVSSWKTGYRGLVSDSYLDALDVDDMVSKWENWLEIVQPGFVAYTDTQAAGFISCGKIRTRPPGDRGIVPLYAAEVYALYVKPDYFRKGLGKALMIEAAKSLKEKKLNSLVLWVIKKNKPALSFYEGLGGQRIGKVKKEVGGMIVEESAIGWRDVSTILERAAT